MCGFLVVGGPQAKDRDLRSLVRALLGRRGPDGVARLSLDVAGTPIQMGHAQFDVIDRSGNAHQPMVSASGRCAIVYNGEVYNHVELGRKLGAPGGGWRTHTDTEVLLEGLEREGPDFLERTNGMFAFVFVRDDPPEVLVARDRLGIRPVYHAQHDDGWVIASTLRSVLAAGVVPFELSPEGLRSFLTFGSVYEPNTIARNVHAVAPGTWRRWRPASGWEERTWWSLPEPSGDHDASATSEEIREILLDAISVRTHSGYPLGAFVSGGTDSSALAILLAEELHQPFSSFSLAFEGSDGRYSEATYQRRIAERCGSTHREIVVSRDDARQALDGFFDQMDQPSIDGFNVFLVSAEAARSGTRTCLAGTGGDEVFAGYTTFASADRFSDAIRQLARLPDPARNALASPLSALARVRPLEPRLGKPAHLVGRTDTLEEYYALRRALFLPWQLRDLCGTAPEQLAPALSYRPESEAADVVNLWSAFELGNYLRNTLMRDGDVFSMVHAVEIRYPMLDHRLIEAVLRIGGASKISRTEHKPLLQAAMRGRLPRFTWDRPKMGFTLPWEEWLQRGFLPPPDLSSWLDVGEVRNVVRAFHRNPTNQRSWSRLWSLHVLERYLRRGDAAPAAA